MAQKLADIEKNERQNIEDELDTKSQALGMESYESYGSDTQTGLKALLGMCAGCKNLNYCKTEFGNVHALCGAFEFKLSGKNRIVECNLHQPKNVLSLNEMYAIAYLIDVSDGKQTKGFTGKIK